MRGARADRDGARSYLIQSSNGRTLWRTLNMKLHGATSENRAISDR